MSSHEQYLGNPNLKKANVAQNFTKKQVSEFLKCAQDPVYFAQKYVKIINLDEGLVPFQMYDFQEKLVNNFHNNRFNICKMPRQSGKSTTVVSYLLHYAIFNDSVTIGILANKAQTARDLLGRLQIAYENLHQVDATGYHCLEQGIYGIGEQIQDHCGINLCICRSGYVIQHHILRRICVRCQPFSR